jgi:hypothetical protein
MIECHDIAEILQKLALNTNQSMDDQCFYHLHIYLIFFNIQVFILKIHFRNFIEYNYEILDIFAITVLMIIIL